jgi:hypothetical protein
MNAFRRSPEPPLRDTRLRWLGPLVLFGFGTVFFRLEVYLEGSRATILRFVCVAIASGYLFWMLARWMVLRVQRRFPGLENTRKRLLVLALELPILVNLAVFFRIIVHALLQHKRVNPTLLDYVTTAGIQVFYHCVYFGVYEGWYVLRQWRQTFEENEELLKVQWQARFDSLKNQVNPHFLFNSLNTLSSLIDESPRLATAFVDELSSVYRYLLRSNEADLASLADELRFIQSYFHLLKTRYGRGIALEQAIDPAWLEYRLPPLTLQLLVENAVKHNAILPDQPLTVSLRTDAFGRLLVSNNLQRKVTKIESNKVGLSNIAARFRLLGQAEPLVEERNGWFTVTLPLVAPVRAKAEF